MNWTHTEIKTFDEWENIFLFMKSQKITYFGLDTETNTKDKIFKNNEDIPFLIQFGFISTKHRIVFFCWRENLNVRFFELILQNVPIVIAYNIKFDIHMLKNIEVNNWRNYNIFDAWWIAVRKKPINKYNSRTDLKFVASLDDPEADVLQKEVKSEVTRMKRAFKKGTFTHMPSYEDVDRDLMLRYAINDVKIMLEYVEKNGIPNDTKTTIERNCVYALIEQERTPFYLDLDYIKDIEDALIASVSQNNKDIKDIIKIDCTVNQNKVIKEILYSKWKTITEKTDIGSLKKISQEKIPPDLEKFIEIVLRGRTENKWRSTYLKRFRVQAKDGKWYASYNQFGANTGRLSSTIHQLPRSSLKVGDKEFIVKKIFKIPKDYSIVEIDYANQELRIAAHYTIAMGCPDVNLINAFMCYKRDPKTWKPVDLHTLTSQNAFGKDKVITKELRMLGKRVNFAVLYGCGLKGLKKNKDINSVCTERQIEQLFDGFRKTFPNVIKMRNDLMKTVEKDRVIHNAFGIPLVYDGIDTAYFAINVLFQGTGAYLLKKKMYEVDKYLLGKKSKMLMNLHDSLAFYIHKDEEYIVKEIQAIMEDNPWCHLKLKTDVKQAKKHWT